MKKSLVMLAAALGLASLAGCGGGDANVKVQGTTTITTGQELQDLQRALTEGAINQNEYDTIKKGLLQRSK
jgi:ABC-type glycerol-3-phosphate transport system substrate-binding protein